MKSFKLLLALLMIVAVACDKIDQSKTPEDEICKGCNPPDVPFTISLMHHKQLLKDEDLSTDLRFKISKAPEETKFWREVFVPEKHRLEPRKDIALVGKSIIIYYATMRFDEFYTDGGTHVRFLHIQPPYRLSRMFFEFEVEYKGEKVFSDKVYFTLKSSDGKELKNYNTILGNMEYDKNYLSHKISEVVSEGQPVNRVDLSIDFRKIISEYEKKGVAEKEK